MLILLGATWSPLVDSPVFQQSRPPHSIRLAVMMVLQGRFGDLFIMLAPVCSSFSTVNLASSFRSLLTPLGADLQHTSASWQQNHDEEPGGLDGVFCSLLGSFIVATLGFTIVGRVHKNRTQLWYTLSPIFPEGPCCWRLWYAVLMGSLPLRIQSSRLSPYTLGWLRCVRNFDGLASLWLDHKSKNMFFISHTVGLGRFDFYSKPICGPNTYQVNNVKKCVLLPKRNWG